MNLFKLGLEINPARALEVTMEAVLTSGSFLYQSEIGESPASPGKSVALTPHELASAVSFALVDSVPDAELDAKATDGSLLKPSVLAPEVDRLLATPAAKANLQKKVSYYLGLETVPYVKKDETTFPEYLSLRGTLYEAAQRFLGDVMWQGHFAELFTSHRVYANQKLASAYGIPGVFGADLAVVDLDGDERGAGILTQPAFLAATNRFAASDDVIGRGLFVYNFFACGVVIGAPPPNESEVFRTLMGTEDEKARQRDALPACGACHNAFDPFGFVSEKYDPIGRYRPIDPDQPDTPIDVSAVIKDFGPDLDGPVTGINDLAQRLAKGQRAPDCAARNLLKMTLNHDPTAQGSCELDRIKRDFVASGSFAEFFKAILTSPAFLTRDWDKQ